MNACVSRPHVPLTSPDALGPVRRRSRRPAAHVPRHDGHVQAHPQERRGGQGRQLRDRAGRAVRPPRPQRRRQDDHDQDAHHAADPDAAAARGCSAATSSPTSARCARASATSSAATAVSTSGSRALDNLRYFSELYGVPPARAAGRIGELLELVGLTGREKERVEGFSRGMRQRLHIARGPAARPRGALPRRAVHRHRPGRRPRAARDHRAAARAGQDDPADDALHVRGRRALRPDRGDPRPARSSPQGTPAQLKERVSTGRVLEVETYGVPEDDVAAIGELDSVRTVTTEVRGQLAGARHRLRSPAPSRPTPSCSRARRRRHRPGHRREPTLEDAYVELVTG